MKVIYYPELRLRFFCQDKCASTTLDAYFASRTTQKRIHWDRSTPNADAPWNVSFEDIMAAPVDMQFTVIRNTWDRLASNHRRFQQRLQKDGRLHEWFDRWGEPLRSAVTSDNPFGNFVRFICSQGDEIESHWQPQTYRLPLREPNFHIVRLEHLARDFARAGGLLAGIDVTKLGSFNRTRDGEQAAYRSLYTDETRRLVERRYLKEIELFGFEF